MVQGFFFCSVCNVLQVAKCLCYSYPHVPGECGRVLTSSPPVLAQKIGLRRRCCSSEPLGSTACMVGQQGGEEAWHVVSQRAVAPSPPPLAVVLLGRQ